MRLRDFIFFTILGTVVFIITALIVVMFYFLFSVDIGLATILLIISIVMFCLGFWAYSLLPDAD